MDIGNAKRLPSSRATSSEHVPRKNRIPGIGVLCAEQPGIVSPVNANSNRIDVYSPSRLSYPPCSILSLILPFLLLFRSLLFRTLLFVSIPVNS